MSRKVAELAEPPRLIAGWSRWASLVLGAVLVLVFFSAADDGLMTIANYTLIAALAALALNVLSGYTGQVSLGIAFFMALGAYTAAWLGGEPPSSPRSPWGLGLPFYLWLPAAGGVSALVGLLVGPTALRLKGFYLGIVSLALIFIGHYLFLNATGITGGPQGRTFPTPAFGEYVFSQQNEIPGILALTPGQQYFLLNLLVLVLCGLFVGNVMRSRAGRAFQAVRDHEVGAAIMGVNLFEAKMGAFVLSSFLAGVAGALFASYNRYVVPDYWSLALSIQFVAAIIIGGVASVWGSILGTVFVFAIPLLIDRFSLLPPRTSGGIINSGDLNAFIYGLLIIFFLLFEPTGIIGLARRSRWVRKKREEGGEAGEPLEADETVDPGTS
jgi:branched-chain amino acid transport system permease protein